MPQNRFGPSQYLFSPVHPTKPLGHSLGPAYQVFGGQVLEVGGGFDGGVTEGVEGEDLVSQIRGLVLQPRNPLAQL